MAQMNELKHKDPDTWESLKEGVFCEKKSARSFTYLFTDQTVKQQIWGLKGLGDIKDLSQPHGQLQRLLITIPHVARIAEEFLNEFSCFSTSTWTDHCQLAGVEAIRSTRMLWSWKTALRNTAMVIHSSLIHLSKYLLFSTHSYAIKMTHSNVTSRAKNPISSLWRIDFWAHQNPCGIQWRSLRRPRCKVEIQWSSRERRGNCFEDSGH